MKPQLLLMCYLHRPVTRGVHGVRSHPPTGPKGPHFETHYPSFNFLKEAKR